MKKSKTCFEVFVRKVVCGRQHVAESRSCQNEHLRERRYNQVIYISGHLELHCRNCARAPNFIHSNVLNENTHTITREIFECRDIGRLVQQCASTLSV